MTACSKAEEIVSRLELQFGQFDEPALAKRLVEDLLEDLHVEIAELENDVRIWEPND